MEQQWAHHGRSGDADWIRTRMTRFLDITLCSIGIVLSLPIMVTTAVATLMTSGRPILFRQKRIGRDYRPFILLKFRTMHARGKEGDGFEAGSNARVTRLGRLLRRFKLDELPQMFNILKGDMAIVGPRPEVQAWVDQYPDLFRETLRVRPGLSDLGAVVFPNEHDLLRTFEDPEEAYRGLVMPVKLELSTQYLAFRTPRSDIVIMWATFCAIVGLPHPWSHIDASALLQARRDRLDAEGRR